MTKTLIIVLSALITLQCCNSITEKEMVENIPVDFEQIESVTLDDLIYDIKLIPLDKKNAILSTIVKVIVFRNQYIIWDESDQIFFFDEGGFFLNKIDEIGSGPGEYNRIDDISVSPAGFVLILDGVQKKLLKFDIENFTFVDELSFTFSTMGFECVNEHEFIFFRGVPNQDKDEKYQIYILDDNLNITSKHLPYENGTSVMFAPRRALQIINNQVGCMPIFEQKIYKYDGHDFSPRYNLDLGQYNMDKEMLLNNTEFTNSIDWLVGANRLDFVYFLNYYESIKNLYFYFYMNGKDYFIIYNKEQKSNKMFNYISENYLAFNGKPIAVSTEKDQFISVINPIELLAAKEKLNIRLPKEDKYREIEEIINAVDYNDNSIIMQFSIRQ